MKLKIYAVRDAKVEAWLPPVYARHKGEALRGLEEAANNPTHPFCQYPEDHAFFEIGEFDDCTGTISTYLQPVPLGLAAEFKNRPDTTQLQKDVAY